MQPRSLLPYLLLALGVSAIPAHVKRDEAPNYVNDDGSIDFSALTADAAIVPTIVAPAQASNVILPIDTEAISEDVVSQAADQADSPAKRGILEKRASTPAWAGYGTCGAQTLFTQAKVPSPDTPDAFRAESSFRQAARTAAKPSGYTLEYVALNGVYQSASSNSYLGMKTLTSAQGYNPQICADACSNSVMGCLGFNIYYERDPPINLDSKTKPDGTPFDLSKCNNPPSVTQIACMFYGSPVNAAAATSTGQVRGDYFRTAKAGSNGYSKSTFTPPAVSGFTAPQTFGGGKVVNQKVVGKIAGTHLLTMNPNFDPQYCADVANSKYAGRYSSFETFMLKKDGAYVGQGCIVLTEAGFTSDDARDAGQFGGKSSTYDETNVWYSSQPVYYYEKAAAAPTTPTAPTGSEELLTFETSDLDPAQIRMDFPPYAKLLTSYRGFTFISGEDWGTELSVNMISLWPLQPATGNFGGCYVTNIPCKMTLSGEKTFDVRKLDVADMQRQPGTVIFRGYRSGSVVVSQTFHTTGQWATYTLTGFTNLDGFEIDLPRRDNIPNETGFDIGFPAFDNIDVFKHSKPVKRQALMINGGDVPDLATREESMLAMLFNGTMVELPRSCGWQKLLAGECGTIISQ